MAKRVVWRVGLVLEDLWLEMVLLLEPFETGIVSVELGSPVELSCASARLIDAVVTR